MIKRLEPYRDQLRHLGITPLISRKRIRDTNQSVRWVVEQTLALLHQFRRLATRWECRTDIHHGFLALGLRTDAYRTECVRSSYPLLVKTVIHRPD